ncbi:hypothetical protein AGLY_013728 [Aphis glycines]|uniref:Uncharacterized protein n=1 Tax=Aphis glycines TaxID=307491 RepID=A0A6G0T7H0_APHGL|nr:hypothetical protein AGLY_013728 [Aphis glycines]
MDQCTFLKTEYNFLHTHLLCKYLERNLCDQFMQIYVFDIKLRIVASRDQGFPDTAPVFVSKIIIKYKVLKYFLMSQVGLYLVKINLSFHSHIPTLPSTSNPSGNSTFTPHNSHRRDRNGIAKTFRSKCHCFQINILTWSCSLVNINLFNIAHIGILSELTLYKLQILAPLKKPYFIPPTNITTPKLFKLKATCDDKNVKLKCSIDNTRT